MFVVWSFMKIQSLELSNFKSFNHINVDFKDFTLLVGANASGKTNFTNIFRFLKYAVTFDPANAYAKLGGKQGYFSNKKLSNEDASLKVVLNEKEKFSFKFINPQFYRSRSTIQIAGDLTNKKFESIALYDFDIKKIKAGSPFEGSAFLEEDGSNLSLILQDILTNDDKRETLKNLLTSIFDYFDDINIEGSTFGRLFFSLQETYCDGCYFPAPMLSDGTINVLALLTALFFEENDVIIIEEPERYIHPHLISRLMALFKDAARNKQLIVTTHSPEFVKHASLEDLLFIFRDKDGFSQLKRPVDSEAVKTFLDNDLGLNDLFVDNFLGL